MVDNLENLNPRPAGGQAGIIDGGGGGGGGGGSGGQAGIIGEAEPFLNAQLRPEQWNELLDVLSVLHAKLVDTQDRLARIEKHLGVVKSVPPVPGRRDLQL